MVGLKVNVESNPNLKFTLHKIRHQHHAYQSTRHQSSPTSRSQSLTSTIIMTHSPPQLPPSPSNPYVIAASIGISLANNNPKTMVGIAVAISRPPCSPLFTAAHYPATSTTHAKLIFIEEILRKPNEMHIQSGVVYYSGGG